MLHKIMYQQGHSRADNDQLCIFISFLVFFFFFFFLGGGGGGL